MRRILLALGLVAAASAAGKEVSTGSELLHIRGAGLRDTIMRSNDMWLLTVLEADERCGEQCGVIRDVLSKVESKADGIMRFAYTTAHDLVVDNNDETVPIHQLYNVTQVPFMLVYPAGKKVNAHLTHPMRFEAQIAGQLLSGGPKVIYENLRMFIPTMVTSNVKGKAGASNSIADFLTKEAPALPRVLLFQEAKSASEVPLTLKRLALDFASRAVFGTSRLDDKSMVLAFNSTAGRKLFVSQAGPHSASTSSDPAPNAYASTWSTYPSESQKMTYPLLKQWLDSVLPQPVPPQLTKPSDYDRYCNANNAGVCFIAVLPAGAASDADAEAAALKGAEIVDADAVERASGPLTVFRRIAASNYIQPDYQTIQTLNFVATRPPMSFSWVDASEQSDWVSSFSVSAPGLIALNPRKKLFAVLKNSFSDKHIDEFIFSMLNYRPSGSRQELDVMKSMVDLQPIDKIPVLATQVVKAPKAEAGTSSGGKKKKAASAGSKTKKVKKAAAKPAADAAAAAEPAVPVGEGAEL